ncbi:MAG: hypothetical protein KDB21_11290 [Acidimicrobiales bacterium]|nr:hypothetical protein [Acidimicrobiales bacterium]
MSANHWPFFEAHHLEPDEVFALLALRHGGYRSSGARSLIGDPAAYEVWFSGKGNPMIRCLAGKRHAAALADELAELLRPTRRWFTTVMTGHFRLSGSFVSDDIQIRPIDDLRSAAFTSLPGVRQNPSRHQPRLSAALIDFAYTGGDDSFVAMRRMDVAMRDVCNLVTLSTLRSMSQPVGGEQWNLVWDESLSEMRNVRLHAGFDHPELGEKEGPPHTGANRVETVDHARFAAGAMDLLSDGEQRVVETSPLLLLNLQNLRGKVRRQARVALEWYARGRRAPSNDEAVVAYTTGIEALLPPSRGEQCQECSAPMHSNEKRVNQFLDEFAGREMRAEFRKVVYEQRSRIVHGALLHDIDHPFMSVGGSSDMDVLCVQGSVHAALLNWLRQPPTDT